MPILPAFKECFQIVDFITYLTYLLSCWCIQKKQIDRIEVLLGAGLRERKLIGDKESLVPPSLDYAVTEVKNGRILGRLAAMLESVR